MQEAKTHESMRGYSSSNEDNAASWLKASTSESTAWPSDLLELKAPSYNDDSEYSTFRIRVSRT